jgi:hypothetical protein
VSRRLRRTGLDPIRDGKLSILACVRRAKRIASRRARNNGHETAALSHGSKLGGQREVDPADELYVKEILSLVDPHSGRSRCALRVSLGRSRRWATPTRTAQSYSERMEGRFGTNRRRSKAAEGLPKPK